MPMHRQRSTVEDPHGECAMSVRFLMSCLLPVAAALGLGGMSTASAVEPAAQTAAEPAAQAAADPAERAHPDCLRATGSRIAAARNRRAQRDARSAHSAEATRNAEVACVPASGRVYTRDDIDGTGAIELGDALRMLDPGIR